MSLSLKPVSEDQALREIVLDYEDAYNNSREDGQDGLRF